MPCRPRKLDSPPHSGRQHLHVFDSGGKHSDRPRNIHRSMMTRLGPAAQQPGRVVHIWSCPHSSSVGLSPSSRAACRHARNNDAYAVESQTSQVTGPARARTPRRRPAPRPCAPWHRLSSAPPPAAADPRRPETATGPGLPHRSTPRQPPVPSLRFGGRSGPRRG